MGLLSISSIFTPASAQQWLSSFLTNAATVGLSTTAWQSGGITRTVFSILSTLMSGEDALVSMAAQGGFLDFAATGTVTYTAPNGQTVTQFVTPDPSQPSQWPTPGVQPPAGWLDFLADSTYNVQRIGAQGASGTLYLLNTGSPSSAYPTGTYHVADGSGNTYSNTSSLTIASSVTTVGGTITGASSPGLITITTSGAHGLTSGAIVGIGGVQGNAAANGIWQITVTGANTFTLIGSSGNGVYVSGGLVYTSLQQAAFAADVLPPLGPINVAAGTITQPVTSVIGVYVGNPFTFFGQNIENNVKLAARCRLKTQSASPNGPLGAYAYFALSASQFLSGQVLGGVQEPTNQSLLLGGAVTQALVAFNTANGTVTTTVANGSGAVAGAVNLPVSAATNASPIVLTVSSTTGLTTGMNAKITGVQGNTAANGYWPITVVNGTQISLQGSTGSGTYTSGGIVEAGDLGLVDSVIQANCVPNGTTATTQSASPQTVTVAATVYVPAAQASAALAAVAGALTAYQATIPIGGFTTGVPTPGTLPYNEVLGIITSAAPYIRTASLTLNGGTSDVSVGSSSVVVFGPIPLSGGISIQTF